MKLQRLWVCPECGKHEFVVLNHECEVREDQPEGYQTPTEIEVICVNCGEPYSTITAISY